MYYKKISRSFPLILASASPRRKRLLEQIMIPFDVLPCDIDENSVKGEPSKTARRLAEKKALHAFSLVQSRWILGADTIVVLDDNILGKPANAEEAREMLNMLSSREHEVITGFSIINPSGEIAETCHDITKVLVKKLTGGEIDAYIKTGEPFGKAGAYGIQGIGSFMISAIEGSYSNVVGLSLFTLVETLIKVEALERFPLAD